MSTLLILIATSLTSWSANLNPSIYFIAQTDVGMESCALRKKIVDVHDTVLAEVCPEFYKSCALEGSCAVKHGSKLLVLNYITTTAGIARFEKIDNEKCPYGLGVKGICLDPFYSIAADLTHHQPGDVLFIERIKGLKLPDGTLHDGHVIVRDRGGAIKGPHRFDFFTGVYSNKDPNNIFTAAGLSSSAQSIPYVPVTGPKADEIRKIRNFPRLPPFQKQIPH